MYNFRPVAHDGRVGSCVAGECDPLALHDRARLNGQSHHRRVYTGKTAHDECECLVSKEAATAAQLEGSSNSRTIDFPVKATTQTINRTTKCDVWKPCLAIWRDFMLLCKSLQFAPPSWKKKPNKKHISLFLMEHSDQSFYRNNHSSFLQGQDIL